MTGLLAGKTAVITGGAQGIGLAIAQRFIAEGVQKVKDGAPVAIRIEAPLAGGGPERGD